MSTPPISLEELLAKRRQQQEESQRVSNERSDNKASFLPFNIAEILD